MITADLLGAHKSWSQCAGCGETFCSTAEFDRHRTGDFSGDSRTCLDPTALGLIEIVEGVWGRPRSATTPV
jgi:hypothetical protein